MCVCAFAFVSAVRATHAADISPQRVPGGQQCVPRLLVRVSLHHHLSADLWRPTLLAAAAQHDVVSFLPRCRCRREWSPEYHLAFQCQVSPRAALFHCPSCHDDSLVVLCCVGWYCCWVRSRGLTCLFPISWSPNACVSAVLFLPSSDDVEYPVKHQRKRPPEPTSGCVSSLPVATISFLCVTSTVACVCVCGQHHIQVL